MDLSRKVVRLGARRATSFVLALSLLAIGLTPSTGFALSKDERAALLRQQIADVDLKIVNTQAELAAVGGPSCCLGCGLVWLAVIPGLLIWYFVDVKPKEDKKRELTHRLERLQQEKQMLQNQLMIIEMSD
jgi:hypothetical protein